MCQNEIIQIKIYEEKFHKCVLRKSIRNRVENAKKRLAWCKLNRQKTVHEHSSRVIFSDECKVGSGCVLVWRRPGEEWTPPCLNPGHGARWSLMIWECITYEGIIMGTETIVIGNINAANYIDIIENNVWLFIAHHFG